MISARVLRSHVIAFDLPCLPDGEISIWKLLHFRSIGEPRFQSAPRRNLGRTSRGRPLC